MTVPSKRNTGVVWWKLWMLVVTGFLPAAVAAAGDMPPGLMAGMDGAYVIVTPGGTDPMMFSLDGSPYHLRRFNQTLP